MHFNDVAIYKKILALRPNIKVVSLSASIVWIKHSKETGGTGLGLSIVKHAVQYHMLQL